MNRARKIDSRVSARANQQPPQDWQALREDLLELLNEVEDHVQDAPPAARRNDVPRAEAGYSRNEDGLASRHRAALNNVAQTLQRFSSRDEGDLSYAIEQIRNHQHGAPDTRPERMRDYKSSIQQMSARLEGLGGELTSSHRTQTDVSEIAAQISQLTHTVELLAGAVGESGQVRRLESQIAQLAQAMDKGGRGSQSEVNQRLERLAVTIEQMTDMHHQLADRPISLIEELSSAQAQGFGSIEEGVRGVYDRLDALENQPGIDPAEFERFSAEMAQLADALQKGSAAPGVLLNRVDALNARMNQIERNSMGEPSAALGGLQTDMEALRDAVRDAMEPRLTEMADQIDKLGRKVGKGGNTAPLDDHIRQLIMRMDQTGAQLTEITQLYANGAESGISPDLAALAELVAERTSKAMSHSADKASAAEHRVHEGIKQVDARLARLETMLNSDMVEKAERRPQPAHIRMSAPTATQVAPDFITQPAAARPAPKSAQQPAAPRPATPATKAPAGDAMSSNPSNDVPLVTRGFAPPQPGMQHTPDFQADQPRAREHAAPDIERHPLRPAVANATSDHMPPQGFDPNRVEPPRKPASSLIDDNKSTFAPQRAAIPADEVGSNHNTFIAAARRAAQRQQQDAPPAETSLVARLLGKLRGEREEDEFYPGDPAPTSEPVDHEFPNDEEPESKSLRQRLFGAFAPEETPEEAHDYGLDAEKADVSPRGGIFALARQYRRPLILAGMVLVVSLLALNLLERRLNAPQTAVDRVPEVTTPAPPTSDGIFIQPMLDPQPTGSVDPFMRQIVGAPKPEAQALSSLVSAERLSGIAGAHKSFETNASPGGDTASLETAFKSQTAQMDMPPEAVGPEPLRRAAADGDMRAQFEVAAILGEGQAVPKDEEGSAKWYERSAAQGFGPAEYRLGNIYEHGHGVTKDLTKAKIWYERAAEHGNRMSMHNLAALYASGELGKQDFAKAAAWFERAAGLGLTDSQFNLGMLYARGLGVQQDMEVSYKWFSLAAERGDDGAAKARDDVARSLGSDAVTRLKAEVSKWHPITIDMEANFAPIGTWTQAFNPGQPIADKKVIEQVQTALQRLGYDVGIPDGMMGPRTREAISDFERATGMNESGMVNPRLLAVLGSQPV